MEFWSLLMVASMPVLQVLLVGLLGAILASGYVNLFSANARRDMNKFFGFTVGAVPWLKSLVVGETGPLRVVQDCTALLGNATVPATIIILGGNLTEGLRKSTLKPLVIAAIICARYVILPLSGIGVVTAAGRLGFLPQSPLYRFVLLLQYTVPPAMSIGTMTQLFDACKEECSVLFLWTYLASALALTVWSMVFMSMVS